MRGFAKAPAGATIFGNLKMPSGVASSAAQVILRGADNTISRPTKRNRKRTSAFWTEPATPACQ